MALDFCRNQRYNVIVDGLPSEEMIDIAEDAKEQGYAVDFVVPVMPRRLLELNIATRYERGREEFDEALAGNVRKTGCMFRILMPKCVWRRKLYVRPATLSAKSNGGDIR